MAVYTTNVKELWCDACNFKKTYDSDLVKDGEYHRDLKQWVRDGCPECGDNDRSADYGEAYADQA